MLLARIGLAALAATGLYWSFRLAYADNLARRDDRDDLTRAIGLTPGNARLWTRLDSTAAYEKAVSLNPWDSEALIRSALDAESNGSPRKAENFLLEAVRVDRTFPPAWTLANFYARRNRNREMWAQVRACLKLQDRDPGPVFDFCWRVSDDAALILRAIPEGSEARAKYLAYLIDRSRAKAAQAVYASLDPASLSNTAVLLDYCDFLIARKSAEAVGPWNAAAGPQLWPERGISLVNGDLKAFPGGRGFDWHVPNHQTGISSSFFESGATMRFAFDGEEQESAELFWQPLPLVPGRRYRFQFRFQTADVAAASGLRWCAADRCGQDLHSDEWSGGALDFESPLSKTLARLSLSYKRPPGAMRLKGSVNIADLSLSFRP